MKNLRTFAALLAGFFLWTGAAFAQPASYAKVQTPWYQQGKISGGVAVTNSSAATALPAAGLTAWICNTGSNDAYLAFGTSNAVTATTTGSSWLKSGTCGSYDLNPLFTTFTWMASLTASSTTTLTVETGLGIGPVQLAGGGGGASAVTVADGADVAQGATTDAASTAGGTGTLSAKLRLITTQLGALGTDPCITVAKHTARVNLTASGQVITGTAAKRTYICAIDVVTATAQNIALVEGTGSVCATNIYGLAGGTTAATGWNFAANGGIARGNGAGTVYSAIDDTNGTAANVCLLLSGSGQTSGAVTYVQQ